MLYCEERRSCSFHLQYLNPGSTHEDGLNRKRENPGLLIALCCCTNKANEYLLGRTSPGNAQSGVTRTLASSCMIRCDSPVCSHAFPMYGWGSRAGSSYHCEALNVTKGKKGSRGKNKKVSVRRCWVGAGVPRMECEYTVPFCISSSFVLILPGPNPKGKQFTSAISIGLIFGP